MTVYLRNVNVQHNKFLQREYLCDHPSQINVDSIPEAPLMSPPKF